MPHFPPETRQVMPPAGSPLLGDGRLSPDISRTDRAVCLIDARGMIGGRAGGYRAQSRRFGELRAHSPQPPKRQHVGDALGAGYGEARARAAARKVSRIG